MHAIVKKERGASVTFMSLIERPFLPFDGYLWLAFIGAVAYAGYALCQLDASGYDSDDDNEAFDAVAEGTAKADGHGTGRPGHARDGNHLPR